MDITTFLVLILFALVIYYIFFFVDTEFLQKQAAIRNVKLVNFPNILKIMITKQRFELIKNDVIKKEGKVLGCQMLGKFTIVIADPELVGLVLSKEFSSFPDRRVSFKIILLLMFYKKKLIFTL